MEQGQILWKDEGSKDGYGFYLTNFSHFSDKDPNAPAVFKNEVLNWDAVVYLSKDQTLDPNNLVLNLAEKVRSEAKVDWLIGWKQVSGERKGHHQPQWVCYSWWKLFIFD